MATTQVEASKAVLAELDRLSGNLFNSEDIVFEGDKLILPRSLGSIREGIHFLELKERELESQVDFNRILPYKAWDVAVTLQRVFKRVFGGVILKSSNPFGNASMIDIKVGVNEVVQVPWGSFVIPILPEVVFGIEATQDRELGTVGYLYATGPKKHTGRIQAIFDLVEGELRVSSIYRGKAIDGQDMPEFIDVASVDASKLVYSEQVLADVNAHVFGPIRYPEAFAEEGVAFKKAVLFEGMFGTGKTELLKLVAKVAVENGVTFIMVKPGRDSIEDAMKMARQYGPAVVAFEDVDTVANAELESQRISNMLELFDGMDAKGQPVMVLLTTNYVETLHGGMLRPGRLDKIIQIGELDVAGVQKLITVSLKDERLDEQIDWQAVHKAVQGYLPAFLVAVAKASISYAISRSEGSLNGHRITTEDLVFAGEGYRRQFNLQQGAKTMTEQPSLVAALKGEVRATLVETLNERLIKEEVN